MKIVKLKKEETWWACRLRNEFAEREREREGDVSETGEAVCGGFLDIFLRQSARCPALSYDSQVAFDFLQETESYFFHRIDLCRFDFDTYMRFAIMQPTERYLTKTFATVGWTE